MGHLLYISIISATVPPGTRGRVRSTCLVVWLSCFLLFLRGPQPRGRFSSPNPRCLFWTLFAYIFQTCFFSTTGAKMCPNGSLKKQQNRINLEKILIKTHSWSRPAKRLRLEGAKPLNLTTVAQFQLFFQRPRAPKKESKRSKNWVSGRSKSQKNKKPEHSKKLMKRKTEKSGFLVEFWPQNGGTLSRRRRL